MSQRRKKPAGAYHHGDLRSALLTTAAAVIRERGLHGLSLRECARRLGVSHAAPYRHFGDKAAILGALIGEGFRGLLAAGHAAMEGVADPEARLHAYGVAYVQYAVDAPEHFRVMFGAELEEKVMEPADTAAADEAFELLRTSVAALLAAEGRGDEDPLPGTLAYWSLVHGLATLLVDGRIPAEHLAGEGAVERLTRGVLEHWDR